MVDLLPEYLTFSQWCVSRAVGNDFSHRERELTSHEVLPQPMKFPGILEKVQEIIYFIVTYTCSHEVNVVRGGKVS